MPIPESQLETWSHQGSVSQSSATYNAIKRVLEDSDAPYAGRSIDVYLQGSYGNDTNIYAESDVDIVIQLNDTFQHDLKRLTEDEKSSFHSAYSNAGYTLDRFKGDVIAVLKAAYGDQVQPGDKAIMVASGGSRRDADVIVALQFRRYYKFQGMFDQRYEEGICFYNSSGELIVNYPKQHSANLSAKHQATDGWLKPTVRVVKNLRQRLIAAEVIAPGLAASYYLEGLLYNVPTEKFSATFEDCFVEAFNWIQNTDRSDFLCVNKQYYLLRDGSPVTWRAADCDQFLAAVGQLWKNW